MDAKHPEVEVEREAVDFEQGYRSRNGVSGGGAFHRKREAPVRYRPHRCVFGMVDVELEVHRPPEQVCACRRCKSH